MNKSSILNFMKRLLCFGIRIVNMLLPRSADVVIVRPTHLGDMVMLYDSLRAMRAYYSGKKMVLVTDKCCVRYAELTGFFDRVIAMDGYKKIYKLLGLKAKVMIVPVTERQSLCYRAIYAKERYTCGPFVAECANEATFFNHIIPVEQTPITEWNRNEKMTRAIVGDDYTIKLADFTSMTKKFGDYHGYFAVSLGSQDPGKNWPAERFAAVAQKIYDTYRMPCCLVGTAADRDMADRFLQVFHGECDNLIGKTTLPELFSVLADVRLILCNDTGNMHFSIACRTKCFCVPFRCLGMRFIDYPEKLFDNPAMQPVFVMADYSCQGCSARMESQSYNCVAAVSADVVWNQVNVWLSDNGAHE